MTPQQQSELDRWFEATQAAQPPGTLAILAYIRDGRVFLGRGKVPVEMKAFPLGSLPQVMDLITRAIGTLYDKGPTP